jgi:hypothetical protein
LDFKAIPQSIRVDAAKALAQKGLKALSDGRKKGGASVASKKIERALHYLDVSLAIHEDATVRNFRASCELLGGDAKQGVRLDSVPADVRYAIGSTIAMRGMRKLPQNWVREEYGVGHDKVETAFHYLDIASAVDRNITVMNWRAQCLRLLARWDDALAAFEEIVELAKRDSRPAYLEVAEDGIAFCAARKAEGVTRVGRKASVAAPIADAEYATLATSFVQALVDEDFATARGFLSPTLKKSVSEKSLAKELKSLASKSKFEDFDVVETMGAWPSKRPEDMGWVYIALHGENVEEAVTVVVAKHGSGLAIREVEWGRP